MDDLLNESKSTSFISTIDLRTSYHQVRVHPADQNKTVSVCPFGTYKFLRMAFGLRRKCVIIDQEHADEREKTSLKGHMDLTAFLSSSSTRKKNPYVSHG
ncbi:retrovirus-related Pol polyprotein from transposon opus [Caerostris extrusa]|uniref:Retrovirus-related Pol polyprotein from transposon opus n=1 Tax=Caerostris extrusa TaxID=172846 RepID=A0AAV4UBW3_CAEEX|nr:retrovirus-related Pol polyprotein from transposon opus [Caerostris extrusa]